MPKLPLEPSWPLRADFAVSRISCRTAYVLEQYADNKLIRPLAEYTGPAGLAYIPIDQR